MRTKIDKRFFKGLKSKFVIFVKIKNIFKPSKFYSLIYLQGLPYP